MVKINSTIIKEGFKKIGEEASEIFNQAIVSISNLGLNLSSLQIKGLALIVLIGGGIAVIKFFNKIVKPLNFILIMLIILFIVSIVISI